MMLPEILEIIGLIFSGALIWTFWFISQKEPQQGNRDALKSHPKHFYTLFQDSYKKVQLSILNWLDERLRNAPTSATYSFHFGLILFYAFGLFSFIWAMGGLGNIGAFEIFSNEVPIWQRWLTFLILSVVVLGFFKHQACDNFIQNKLLKSLPEKYSYWTYRFFIAVLIAVYAIWQHEYSALPFLVAAIYSPVVAIIFVTLAIVSFEIAIAFSVAVAFAVIVAVAFPGSRAPRRRSQIQKHMHRLVRKRISRFNDDQPLSRSRNVHQDLIRRFYQKVNSILNRRVSRIQKVLIKS